MKNQPLRRVFLQSLAAATYVLGGGTALAQDYPNKPVKIIVPFTPGGTTDIIARLVAQQLQTRMGGAFVVDNKPGAGGNIGADAVAKSPADGYTLLLVSSNILAINPSLYKKMPFDPETGFAPVSNIVTVTNVIVANPANRYGIKTLSDLVAVAKKHPDTLNFGSTGNASLTHLIGSVLAKTAGIEIRHIPYKGSAPSLQALYGGEVDFAIDNLPAPLSHLASGRLKALAVTGATRSTLLPNVPTVAESGYPGFNLTSWFGLLAPAGTPQRVVSELNHQITEILNDKAVKEKLVAMGTQPAPGSSAQFGAFIKTEVARWTTVVKESGASLD